MIFWHFSELFLFWLFDGVPQKAYWVYGLPGAPCSIGMSQSWAIKFGLLAAHYRPSSSPLNREIVAIASATRLPICLTFEDYF